MPSVDYVVYALPRAVAMFVLMTAGIVMQLATGSAVPLGAGFLISGAIAFRMLPRAREEDIRLRSTECPIAPRTWRRVSHRLTELWLDGLACFLTAFGAYALVEAIGVPIPALWTDGPGLYIAIALGAVLAAARSFRPSGS